MTSSIAGCRRRAGASRSLRPRSGVPLHSSGRSSAKTAAVLRAKGGVGQHDLAAVQRCAQRADRSPMPVTCAGGHLRREERHIGADRGQLLQRHRVGSVGRSLGAHGPGARPRPHRTSRRPARRRPASRFSRVRQTRSGSAADRRPAGRARPGSPSLERAAPRCPPPPPAGPSSRAAAAADRPAPAAPARCRARGSRPRVARSPPATGSAWLAPRTRSGVMPQPPAPGPARRAGRPTAPP